MVALAGCAGDFSALQPRGPVAAIIAEIWWVMFAAATAIFIAVLALVLYATLRAPDRRARIHPTALIVGGGLVFPSVVLAALLVYGTHAGQRMITPADEPLLIEVTARQWWWEVRYPESDGAPEVVTANELHLPVGDAVMVSLDSRDVIHSFWIPNLAGKVDVIPGRTNVLRLRADEAATFFGQCAEFCGAQHAHMKFTVVAQPRAEFDAWRASRARPAAPDEDGFRAFTAAGCHECHAVQGTRAGGTHGPDLTHVGARASLGAATVPNDGDALRRWLERHGHDVKPGNHGPDLDGIDPALADRVAAYLEALR